MQRLRSKARHLFRLPLLSREKCESAFHAREESREGDTVPILEGLRFVATSLDEGLDAGLEAARLKATRIELHTALDALLKNPSLIERWRSGRELSEMKNGPEVTQTPGPFRSTSRKNQSA